MIDFFVRFVVNEKRKSEFINGPYIIVPKEFFCSFLKRTEIYMRK